MVFTALKMVTSWNSIIVMRDFTLVLEQASTDIDKARRLAAQSPHSCHWRHVPSISSCGLCLDNEAVRVAMGPRLDLELCQPIHVHVAP